MKNLIVNKNVEITQRGADVVVYDTKTNEAFFQKPKSEQAIRIANIIYFANKYKKRTVTT